MSLSLTEPAFVFGVLFAVILLAPLVAERLRAPGLIGLILAGGPALELAATWPRASCAAPTWHCLIVSEQDDPRLRGLVAASRQVELLIDARKPPIALRSRVEPGDVVVLGTSPTRAGLGRNAARPARAVPDNTVVVTVPRLQ